VTDVPAITRLLTGAAGWFLRSAGDAGATDAAPGRAAIRPSPSPAMAVLSERAGGLPVGACVALALAGSGVALVACWPPDDRPGLAPPAVPAARRLAGSLEARGVRARAAGRLVVASLPEPETEAAEALRRIDAAAAVARVLVLAGARAGTWDDVLLGSDAVLVDGSDPAVVRLAVERLVDQGVPARALDRLAPRPVRALAAAGLALPGALRPLRAALAEAT
jgi:hypothetical protein